MNCPFCQKPVDGHASSRDVIYHQKCFDRSVGRSVPFDRAEVAKHLVWLHMYSAKPSFTLTLLDRQMIHKAAELLREEQKPA